MFEIDWLILECLTVQSKHGQIHFNVTDEANQYKTIQHLASLETGISN